MNPFESQVEYINESFKKIIFETAQVSNKEFHDCTFSHCSFRETIFRNCRFNDCTFQDCDLSVVKVEGSSFRDTKFERSKVIGVNWTIASWPRILSQSPLSFDECVIDYSTFIGLSLRKIRFKRCTAKEVEFSEADLSDADFSGTDLTESQFRQTNLTRANFEGATNYSIDLTMNKVTKARFSIPEAFALLRGLDIILVE